MVDSCPNCGHDLRSKLIGDDDPQVRELCEMLNRRIVANGYKAAAITRASLGAMERLMRLDNQPYDLVVEMIDWSQSDEFWLNNVRSPQKLRKHFDTMLGQMRRQRRPELERQAMMKRDEERREAERRRQAEANRRTAEEAVPMPTDLREALKRVVR